MESSRPLRRVLIRMAKLILGCAILVFLLVQVHRHEGFERLLNETKQWRFLAAALACTFTAISLSFVRWYLLVRALDLNFHLADAFRLGSLGFVLNFVSFGSVGGDLFKAIFMAREQPGRRTEAVATVMADRVLGLMAMLLLAGGVILFTRFGGDVPPAIALLCQATLLFTGLGLLGFVVLLMPGTSARWLPWLRGKLHHIPLVGPTLARLAHAVGVYRQRKKLLLSATLVSLVVDFLFLLSFYLVARGLPIQAPSLAAHLFIVPLALLAGALPVTPSGLGTQEAALEALYLAVPTGATVLPGDGTIVALGQRLMMVAVALVCTVYYLSRRGEVRRVMEEAGALSEV